MTGYLTLFRLIMIDGSQLANLLPSLNRSPILIVVSSNVKEVNNGNDFNIR